jgi:hypothetical protein
MVEACGWAPGSVAVFPALCQKPRRSNFRYGGQLRLKEREVFLIPVDCRC